MDSSFMAIVVLGIIAAYAFDFKNGFHDAANSIATIVSTRVLSPWNAVAWAAFFNFIAAFGFGVKVAKMIAGDIVAYKDIPDVLKPKVILACLVGAFLWDLVTWYWGLPTSSSHALIGGLCGAAVTATGGIAVLKWSGLQLVCLFIVLAPLIGLTLGAIFQIVTLWIVRRESPFRVDQIFRRLQLVSAAAYSLGHGTNDAQKTMGIIVLLCVGANLLPEGAREDVPFWVVITCHAAIALGTMAGGWRIVKTMGMSITKLRPIGGFCAESAGAATLLGTALIRGIPVSTTHVITGAIMGVGATRRLSAVRWGVTGRIVLAWVVTIPASAAVASLTFLLLKLV